MRSFNSGASFSAATMLRNPNKRAGSPTRLPRGWGHFLAAWALGGALAGPVLGQSKVPLAPRLPDAAPAAPSMADLRASLWAATARFVYADDPVLAQARTELEQTIDDASLKAFGRSLDDAVRVEQRLAPGQNHVLKLQGIFKEIQAQNLPANDLTGLATAIRGWLESNPDRMSNPARKQQLAAFEAQLSQLAAAGGAPGPGAAASPTSSAATSRPSPALDGGPPTADAATGATSPAPEAAPVASPFTSPAAPAGATHSPLPMISLILSALSLLGVLYLLLTRNQAAVPAIRDVPEPPAPPRQKADAEFSPQQYAELEKLVERKMAALSPRQPVNQPTKRPSASQPLPRKQSPALAVPAPSLASVTEGAAPLTPAPGAPEAPTVVELAPVVAPAPRLRTIYVNQQPLAGAFRRDNLADAPASYTIFEITVDEQQAPDQGTFVVTRNEAAHGGYIGSHHSILEPACVYLYPQGPVSRIITDVPGTVQRQPSGDWQIGHKAQIHFA